MAHRIALTTEASVEGVDGRDVVRRALRSVDVPAVSPDASEPDADDGLEPATAADGAAPRSDSGPESGADADFWSTDESASPVDASSDAATEESREDASRADDESP